jgi:hypothetical protein
MIAKKDRQGVQKDRQGGSKNIGKRMQEIQGRGRKKDRQRGVQEQAMGSKTARRQKTLCRDVKTKARGSKKTGKGL